EQSALRRIVFELSNFYLAYQQKDDKDLQKTYAEIATCVLRTDLQPYLTLSRTREPGAKIRFGVASRHLGIHNGSSWAFDWLANLPKNDYEFFLYSLNGTIDHHTKNFASLGTFRWLPFTDATFKLALDTISGDHLDVLLIPDVGMTPSSKILSLTRMAPVQCVAWGHPVTSGSSAIDYYLSSDLMEPENADEHYTEKLIRLPNLGLHLQAADGPVPGTSSREEFALPADRLIYGSVQSVYKYLPQYDYIFPAIVKQVPDSLLVLVTNKSASATTIFRRRLEKAFANAGIDFERHVRLLPSMSVDKFMRLLDVLDVNLDSIGWSGGLTTARTLTLNLPMVTLPGEFMRGRHSYAMLKMIGAEEMIAYSLDDYIRLAVKLGLDQDFRSSLRNKIANQKYRMFNDMACVKELDKLLKAAVAKLESQPAR
ncbi:MAG: hypothetical protein K2Z81_07330, partial [Cyanobacteria bacterium]|nr:hypothetical protein [Cyanobacteriota bacterium]